MIDVFYLTYHDDYSDNNLNRILSKVAKNQRVINTADIDGVYEAHLTCAEQSATENFYVVDGDAWIIDDFDFSYIPSDSIDVYPTVPQTQCTHVWRALNPATGELTGYGGVKLFNRNSFFVKTSTKLVDVTTGVAKLGYPYYRIDKPSNETRFATTPFNAWKGAFRECVKLASGVASDDIQSRLERWKSPLPIEHWELISVGATMGEDFGEFYRDSPEALQKINDFDWLNEIYLDI